MTGNLDPRLEGILPRDCLTGATIWVEGTWRKALDGGSFVSTDPATARPLMTVARGRAADIDAAVAAASKAATVWKNMDGIERARVLRRCAEGIRLARAELGLLDTLDAGRPISETTGRSAESVARLFDFYAGVTDNIRGAVAPIRTDATALVEREPYGVIGAISPWNYPLSNAATKIAPILACGNTLVLKPAEQAPLSALRLASILAGAGLPAGVLNVVTGFGSEAGAALVDHPDVAKLSFTGSTATGRRIAEAAGRRSVSAVLELGGKSPIIVFADGDLVAAAKAVVFSAFGNQGQTCTACTRLIVEEAVKDRLLALVAEEVKSLRIGNPLDPKTQIGPLVSDEQLQRVREYTRRAGGTRVELSFPDYRPTAGGYFHPPTIYTGIDPANEIAKEEIFGPVLTVFAFGSDEVALRLANETRYGLAASIWTGSLSRAEIFRRGLQAGLLWINCAHVLHPGIPLGGFKASGIDSEYGPEAIENYTRPKTTVIMSGGWASPLDG